MRTDTFEFTLAEPSGKWKGSGIGCTNVLYKNSVYFPRKGNYTLKSNKVCETIC